MPQRTCSAELCDDESFARGYCSAHHHRLVRYGDPLGRPAPRAKATCSIENCAHPAYGRGWCNTHWARWRRHGDPLRIPVRQMNLAERLDHEAPRGAADECWPWTGEVDPDGYGVLHKDGRRYRTHRLAWTLTNGPIPDGQLVRHTCDNPPCRNPNHLLLGTQADNVGDAVERGRWVHGERSGMAKLSNAAVLEVKALLEQGFGPTAIGRQFGVSKTQIMRIRDGVSRRTA